MNGTFLNINSECIGVQWTTRSPPVSTNFSRDGLKPPLTLTRRHLAFRFRRPRIPADVEPAFTGCPFCDRRVRRLLDACGPARLPGPPPLPAGE